MNILHICAGWQKWTGAANIARVIIDEQRREGHEVSFATWAKVRELRAANEVWIHCGWLPCLWWAAIWGRNVHWMPEACYDPVRLGFHGWKKWLVGPIERWCLRRCDRIVATCEAEKGWIQSYLGKRCPPVEVTDIKRFFKLVSGGVESGGVESGGVGSGGVGGEIWSGYGGRFIYLKGYRDGTDEVRVGLLKDAIAKLVGMDEQERMHDL